MLRLTALGKRALDEAKGRRCWTARHNVYVNVEEGRKSGMQSTALGESTDLCVSR